mgnify:CR=1 FL=1
MTQEAILYYADNPADFVEDLLHVTPDKNQRAILDSVAKNQMTSVRSGHGIGKSVDRYLVYVNPAISQNPLHGPDAASAIRYSVGGNKQVAAQQ